jgi:hypothetical protein
MGMAQAMRSSMEALFKQQGSTIVIFKNWGTPQETATEVKGVKNHRKNNSKQILFQFMDDPNVQEGDILKQKVASELWRVTRKSETIFEDVILTHDVEVTSMSETARPIRSGHSIIVNAPVHGGIQLDSPHATQTNIVQAGLPATIRDLKELIAGSTLPELEKEDATLALSRVADLSAKPKSADVLAKMGDKLLEVKKIVADGGAIAATAAPLLEKLMQLISQ